MFVSRQNTFITSLNEARLEVLAARDLMYDVTSLQFLWAICLYRAERSTKWRLSRSKHVNLRLPQYSGTFKDRPHPRVQPNEFCRQKTTSCVYARMMDSSESLLRPAAVATGTETTRMQT